MPPKKTLPNVARESTEDQIAYLYRQHESFADWRLLVDERLGQMEASNQELAEGVKALTTGVAGLRETAQVSSQMSAQNHLLLQKVLLVVQGQSDTGLVVPGMADRMSKLETRDSEKDAKITALEQFKFRVLAVLVLLGTLLGWTSYKIAPYFSQILELIK